ncbi:MAG: FliH/SctL family protein [Myxococcales bacterium]
MLRRLPKVEAPSAQAAPSVRDLLSRQPEQAPPPVLTLRVHPADLEQRGELRVPTLSSARGSMLEITVDPSIARGGCRIDSQAAEVQRSEELTLQALMERLVGAPDR